MQVLLLTRPEDMEVKNLLLAQYELAHKRIGWVTIVDPLFDARGSVHPVIIRMQYNFNFLYSIKD